MKIKIIVKRNNENASLKIQNQLNTIDYVLPKAITWLRQRKRIHSIVFVHVLNRKIIILKPNSTILCCFIAIRVVLIYLPVACFTIYNQICDYILKNNYLWNYFTGNNMNYIWFFWTYRFKKNYFKIPLNLLYIDAQKYRKCNGGKLFELVWSSCMMNLFIILRSTQT